MLVHNLRLECCKIVFPRIFNSPFDFQIILEDSEQKHRLEWISATRFEITREEIEAKYEADYYTETEAFPDCNLKLIRSDKVTRDLTEQNCQNIVEAESRHSDLIPAKYEGDFL